MLALKEVDIFVTIKPVITAHVKQVHHCSFDFSRTIISDIQQKRPKARAVKDGKALLYMECMCHNS